jgi:adenylate cyclase
LQGESNQVVAENPDWPRFRAGVNTGPVISGVVGGERGHRKHAVVGDTVNLAARFEGAAPVGEVVIGTATLSGLPEGAEVVELEPLELKGKSQPIAAYLLRALPS